MSQGNPSVERAIPTATAGPAASRAAWTPWAAIAALWALVIIRLSFAWQADLEQAPGWAVPLLFAYIVAERRKSAPEIRACSKVGEGLAWAAVVAGGLVVCLGLPMLEANRLWPTAQWSAAAGAIVASLGLLALSGGVRWSGHFLFPLLFATTALTWPAAVRVPLMDTLARGNAQLTAEVVSLAGHPAVARGNLIEVGNGYVGIDEACSGLRSLAAVWMLAWFLGELHGLTWARRIVVVAVALGGAWVGNLARTVFLAGEIAGGGAAAGKRWHDIAGTVTMVVTLLAVAVLAACLARGRRPGESIARGGAGRGRLARGVVGAVILACAVAEGATRSWFAWHRVQRRGVQWQLVPETGGWRAEEAAPRAREILRASAGDGGAWRDGNRGWEALAFVFRWEDDSQVGMEARYHDPTICMPTVGAVLEAKLAPVRVDLAGQTVPLEAYRFRADGTEQHVFFCLWDAFAGAAVPPTDQDQFGIAERWRRVREGRNRADFTQITFVLQGPATEPEAAHWVAEQAARILRAK